MKIPKRSDSIINNYEIETTRINDIKCVLFIQNVYTFVNIKHPL